MPTDAETILDMLEHDNSDAVRHGIARLMDNANHVDIMADTIIMLLRYPDPCKRDAYVTTLDAVLRWAGISTAFELVFRNTERMLRWEDSYDMIEKL